MHACYLKNSSLQINVLQQILGQIVKRPAILDQELAKELVNCSRSEDDFKVVDGNTMCTLDFYEGMNFINI